MDFTTKSQHVRRSQWSVAVNILFCDTCVFKADYRLRMARVEQDSLSLLEELRTPPVCGCIRVAQSLVYIVFPVYLCLSEMVDFIFFSHFVVIFLRSISVNVPLLLYRQFMLYSFTSKSIFDPIKPYILFVHSNGGRNCMLI